jgi:hypothetical protein
LPSRRLLDRLQDGEHRVVVTGSGESTGEHELRIEL